MANSDMEPGDFCTYGELVRSRSAYDKFVRYDFDPDVAMKISGLVRWATQMYVDYDKVRAKLEGMHAKRGADGSMLRIQMKTGMKDEDGEDIMSDIPNTFQVKDPEAWARDDAILSAGKVWLPAGDRITAEDVDKIRGKDGEAAGPVSPYTIGGLGPFFDWPRSEAEHHSVADDIWKAIEISGKDEESREGIAAA